MDVDLRLILLAVFFLLLALIAIGTLVYFLRKLTVEYSKFKGDAMEKHWWRFVVPTLLAILIAIWLHLGGALWYNYLYLFIVAIGIPVAVSYYLLKEVLEGKNERIGMLVALLFFLNASIFGCQWYWHYHMAHSEEIAENGDNFENPHLTSRNFFFIPLWVITIIVGFAAGMVWRKEGRKENEELLPYHSA